jgi:predicted glycogen debranching enzyme
MTLPVAAEWLEADGLGGFASGRVDLVRSRRYHALLLAATMPPTGRLVLVNGLDATVDITTERSGPIALTRQRYAPDVLAPAECAQLLEFSAEPWPTWTFGLPNGARVVHELFVKHGQPGVALSWRIVGERRQTAGSRLRVRPFFSGRPIHNTQRESSSFGFEPERDAGDLLWQPYPGTPMVRARSNGSYAHDPQWYRAFEYDDERARGLDFVEDLAAPGVFEWSLSEGDAFLLLNAELTLEPPSAPPEETLHDWRRSERVRRASFRSPLHRAADEYIVSRANGRTVIAGYPWFGDWGRDTFIALRGLCLASGTVEGWVTARDVLVEWSHTVSRGMLPNYFPEQAQSAEYNAVDASLWFVIDVHELMASPQAALLAANDRERLRDAVRQIVAGYRYGTRFGIHADADGLLAAGMPGVQLTWMDARVGDRVITPRIGKPVEVQALWINALRIAAEDDPSLAPLADRASRQFVRRFWSEERGYLADVVDVDHQPGTVDWTFRPNQIFAVAGLPYAVLTGEPARRVVERVEAELWTPAGLRSLAPNEPAYRPRYSGDPASRDSAYHQGTVWPWLAGAFIEAWVATHDNDGDARRAARERYLEPLLAHYAAASVGHLTEIADADAPHAPRGCPFQAWSVGEMLRIDRVLAGDVPSFAQELEAAAHA